MINGSLYHQPNMLQTLNEMNKEYETSAMTNKFDG